MDDISEKITDLINSENGIEKIRQLAGGVLNGNTDGTQENPLENVDLTKIMGVIGALNSKRADSRSALLIALKPHLSERRQKKVDSAIKILRLIDVLPLITESGLLNDIF